MSDNLGLCHLQSFSAGAFRDENGIKGLYFLKTRRFFSRQHYDVQPTSECTALIFQSMAQVFLMEWPLWVFCRQIMIIIVIVVVIILLAKHEGSLSTPW